jgi:GTP cyclohydrolase III
MGRRGLPLAGEGSTAFFGRAVILHFDIVDATDNEEDVTASWTFVFVFHW